MFLSKDTDLCFHSETGSFFFGSMRHKTVVRTAIAIDMMKTTMTPSPTSRWSVVSKSGGRLDCTSGRNNVSAFLLISLTSSVGMPGLLLVETIASIPFAIREAARLPDTPTPMVPASDLEN